MDEAKRDQRIGGAQCRGGDVEDEVMRADRHDRAADLGKPTQQLDLYLLTGMVAFQPRRHDEQSVGAHQRCQHAGAARQRGGDDLVADATEPNPHPIVGADRRSKLAGQTCGRRRPLARSRPFERSQQRRGEDVEGQRRGHRVARRTEHRGGDRASDRSENDGMTGLDRDPVDCQ